MVSYMQSLGRDYWHHPSANPPLSKNIYRAVHLFYKSSSEIGVSFEKKNVCAVYKKCLLNFKNMLIPFQKQNNRVLEKSLTYIQK